MKHTVRMLLALAVTVTFSGCASISLVNSWKDPGVTEKQYRKLLVVGIADRPQMRQVFEEVFAGEVSKSGAIGITSYTLTGVEGKPTQAALDDAVKKSGADGIVTTRLVDMKRHRDDRSGFVLTSHGTTAFYGASVSYATFVHQPVEVTTSTEAAIETTLFDTGTSYMVWSATSSAVNPEGIITVSREVADIVIKAMTRDGLL
jgi:hypothetical protein